MSNAQAPALAQAGARLHEEAREHMRSARYHRRRAAELHRQVEDIRQECASHGIELVIETHQKPQSPGETSGNTRSRND